MLDLDPSTVERPYFDNVMRTFYVESALLAALRRFPEAFKTFERAHSYFESDPPIPSTEKEGTAWPHVLHRNQGLLYYFLGDLSSAIDHYLKALRKTPAEDLDFRVAYHLDVGLLHQRTQDYRSARHYYARAERLFRQSKLRPDAHPSLWGEILSSRSDFLLEKTLNTEFERAPLERARDLARRARTVSDPHTKEHAEASMTLSETLGYLGHFGRAYQLNEEARQYAQANDATRLHAFSLLKLGVLHIQTHRWTQADRTLNRALRQAEDLGDLDSQRRILRALGRLHEQQKGWSQAESYYRQGVAVIEKYRES
ncbi:MAG: hypothetical protein BRD40_01000, partial [Bacteroidetes bacterium QS_1_65_9]